MRRTSETTVVERSFPGFALGAAPALGIAACQNDAAGPGQPALSEAEAALLAQGVAADMDAVAQGAAVGNSDVARFPSAAIAWSDRAGDACVPARSPATPENSDADPVPDSVRLDFAGCVITMVRGTT